MRGPKIRQPEICLSQWIALKFQSFQYSTSSLTMHLWYYYNFLIINNSKFNELNILNIRIILLFYGFYHINNDS